MTLSVLLTRPEPQSRRFAEQVRNRLGPGTRIVIAPLLRIDPLPVLPVLAPGEVPVFTSESGVACWACLGGRCAGPAFAVGGRSAAVARRHGFAPVTEGPGDGAGLAARIAAEVPPGTRLRHLHGTHVAGDLVAALRARGLAAEATAIYDQAALPLSVEARALLAERGPVLVPVFSPRSARLLAPDLAKATAELRLAAISPAVAEVLPVQSAGKVAVAARAEAEAVLNLLAELANGSSFLERRPGAG